MNTAIRRHHYQRIKNKRKRYWGGPVGTEVGVRYGHTEEERLGMLASTPHPCSCIGCSDLRRLDGPPRNERRAPKEDEWSYYYEENYVCTHCWKFIRVFSSGMLECYDFRCIVCEEERTTFGEWPDGGRMEDW